jgi:hypothetical protein
MSLHPQSQSQTGTRWRLIVASVAVVIAARLDGLPLSAGQGVSRAEADRIMQMDYRAFAALRQSPQRPAGYRWDTDGCTPDWAPTYFTRACHLHDFGYRNYGSARKDAPHLSPRRETKDWIDRRFHQEMVAICTDEAKTDKGRATCNRKAGRLYEHVKKGRNAFFGPFGT